MAIDVNFRVQYTPDRKVANTTINGAKIAFDAEDLENIARTISTVRMHMEPPVPKNPAGDATVVADALWAVMPENDRGGVVLAVRHPGLGWLYMHMPKGLCEVIGPHLAAAPATPKPPTSAVN